MEVSFVTSAPDLRGRPERVLPEFAFIGRSNCGKSSLINFFLGRNRLAKTSRQPGKTRLLNYFLVGDRYYLVDLPGYGYAKVSQAQRESWSRLIQSYLTVGDRPLAVFHLLDVRRRPSPQDAEVQAWLQEAGHPHAVVPTKIDKVGRNQLSGRYREIINVLGLDSRTPFLPTSVRSRIGREDMQSWVAAVLAAADDPGPGGW